MYLNETPDYKLFDIANFDEKSCFFLQIDDTCELKPHHRDTWYCFLLQRTTNARPIKMKSNAITASLFPDAQTYKHIIIAIHNVGGLPLAHYRQRLDIYSRCACNVDTHHDGEILIIITRYLICGDSEVWWYSKSWHEKYVLFVISEAWKSFTNW